MSFCVVIGVVRFVNNFVAFVFPRLFLVVFLAGDFVRLTRVLVPEVRVVILNAVDFFIGNVVATDCSVLTFVVVITVVCFVGDFVATT